MVRFERVVVDVAGRVLHIRPCEDCDDGTVMVCLVHRGVCDCIQEPVECEGCGGACETEEEDCDCPECERLLKAREQ